MMEMFAGIRYTVVEKGETDPEDTGVFVSLNDLAQTVANRVHESAEFVADESLEKRELAAAVAMGAMAVVGILSDIEQDYMASVTDIFTDSTIQEFLEGGGKS